MMWIIVQALINGLLTGGIYALVSVGITILFGVMRIVNFAAGEFVTIGMYMTYVAFLLTGLEPYFLFPIAIICMIVIAVISYSLCIQPLLKKKADGSSFILVTVGLSFVLLNLLQIVFGTIQKSIPSALKTSSINLAGWYILVPRLIAFVVALCLVCLLSVLLGKTKFGRSMRATSENEEVSQMLGINTQRVFLYSFIISIVFLGLAGLLLTPVYSIGPTSGSSVKTIALMIVVLGGMGSIKGALIAGLLVGIAESYVASFVSSDIGPVGVFIVFLIVVYFKPQGLFGRRERIA